MKKIFVLNIFLVLSIYAFSITYHIKQDGTGDFTSIQSGINASQNGDIVLVYPGTYYENINYQGKNITIASLFHTTGDPVYKANTIIDGNHVANCVLVENNVTNGKLIGMTLMNGKGTDVTAFIQKCGGGILIRNYTTFFIDNCIIKNNSGNNGAGITLYNNSILNLSNSTVKNNLSIGAGGGLFIGFDSIVNFDSVNRSSIYNNYGDGADIMIFWSEQPTIYLDTLSVILEHPDNFFVKETDNVELNIEVNHAYLSTINHDLYVSTTGDDNNDGLSFDQPLRTIAYATHLIESDSLNPKTIHLDQGVYSPSLNNQKWPIILKDFVSLSGYNEDNTILDSENNPYLINLWKKTNNNISHLSLINCLSSMVCSALSTPYSKNIHISNLNLRNNYSAGATGIYISLSQNIELQNIVIKNQSSTGTSAGIDIYHSDDILINNVILDSLESIDNEICGITCLNSDNSDIIVNNIIMSNNKSYQHGVFGFSTDEDTEVADTTRTLSLSNCLIINNECLPVSPWGGVFNVQNIWDCPIYLSNITASNNTIINRMFTLMGNVLLNNIISYNPQLEHEFLLFESSSYLNTNVSFDYSCIRGGQALFDYVNVPIVNWGSHNIDTDPLFVGGDPSFSASYYLQENSPCVNAGTPDTTGLHIYPVALNGVNRIYDGRIDMGCFEYGISGSDDTIIPDQGKTTVRNYPNPIVLGGKSRAGNPYTIFEFSLKEKIKKSAKIEIYNIKGQKVRTLETHSNLSQMAEKAGLSEKDTGQFKSDAYSIMWDAKGENYKALPTGVYLYVLSVDGHRKAVNKCLLIK